MPQETKSRPFDAEESEDLGFEHEKLEGWIPSVASEDELCLALDKAFDYRGDVTLVLRDEKRFEGYIFDRRGGKTLADSFVRIIPKNRDEKIAVCYGDILRIEFTGKDTAAGKSFETWVKKYHAKKAAGEKDIRLEPEKLD
jgi:hypothetical protein